MVGVRSEPFARCVVVGVIFLGWSTRMPDDWMSWQEQAATVVGFIGVPIVGGLIASHRPANSYGWL
jgi:hypothetical protein